MRIADRWFERQGFDDGIARLWEPHVHPLARCNVWHLRGRERDLIVDTGLGVASVRDVPGREQARHLTLRRTRHGRDQWR